MSAMFQQLLQAPHMSISRLVAIAGLMQPPVIIIAWLNRTSGCRAMPKMC
jgi:hypothetical protein